ncbi:MAG: mobile mystery protein B [Ignavibacteria bacterium]|nr:mobile mystery protein B [Ignavibacteria bacterium]
MGLDLEYIDAQTPLDEDEKEGLLIKTITTKGELDEFEQLNIEKAIEWTISRKFKTEYLLSEKFVKDLHYKMFCDTWSWAGEFRKTNKNIGVDKYSIGVSLRQLIDDCKYWIENETYPEDEIAIRFKHKIVNIHCFSNGNGRHSRLIADVIINKIFGKPYFTWSSNNLNKKGEARNNYLKAIKEGDKGNIQPLIEFAKS